MTDFPYPLVVYGPSGEPRDVFSAEDEAARAQQGYRRHWHMGGTYGLPVVPAPVETDAPPPVVPDADEAPVLPPPVKRGRPSKLKE